MLVTVCFTVMDQHNISGITNHSHIIMDDRPGLTNEIRSMNVSTPVEWIEFVCEDEAMIVGGRVPVPYICNIKSHPIYMEYLTIQNTRLTNPTYPMYQLQTSYFKAVDYWG